MQSVKHNKLWFAADYLRLVAGCGFLASCLVGSLAYLGIPLPPGTDWVMVGLAMAAASYFFAARQQ